MRLSWRNVILAPRLDVSVAPWLDIERCAVRRDLNQGVTLSAVVARAPAETRNSHCFFP
jgi:hypothetical protein